MLNIRDISCVSGVPCTLPAGKKIMAVFAGITDFERMLILDRASWIGLPRKPQESARITKCALCGLSASVSFLGQNHARRRTGSGHRSSLDRSSEENVVADIHERREAKMTFEMNFHQIIAIWKLCRKSPAR